MTVTLTSNKYPRKLVEYLKSERGAIVEAVDNGIYYIKNTDIETQFLVSKELDDEGSQYLKLLQTDYQNKNLIKKWIAEYIDNIKNPLYAVIMDVLAEVNPNEILEGYKNMGRVKLSEDNREFLLDMMKKLELDKKLKQEGIEEGIEKGIERGIERGIEEGKEEGIRQLILRQYKKGLTVEYIADINDIDIEYVKKVVSRVE
ncbi:hypothetical protein CLRAG_38860 [Clostridium ragsdalei P11]|uniref:Flagellar assembly protein H n=1 Tax=Clostridium ragsdalei P11 TaxID=1353534 RepID=A0A1A6AIK5_9CLOT|nr:hypothetical protein CLRAG_38860 [Clostridium ragsdalei P11]